MRKRELSERIEAQAREIAELKRRVGAVEARPIVPYVPWVAPYYPRHYWWEYTHPINPYVPWCDSDQTISVGCGSTASLSANGMSTPGASLSLDLSLEENADVWRELAQA